MTLEDLRDELDIAAAHVRRTARLADSLSEAEECVTRLDGMADELEEFAGQVDARAFELEKAAA